jgi:hypothetical protein
MKTENNFTVSTDDTLALVASLNKEECRASLRRYTDYLQAVVETPINLQADDNSGGCRWACIELHKIAKALVEEKFSKLPEEAQAELDPVLGELVNALDGIRMMFANLVLGLEKFEKLQLAEEELAVKENLQ